MSNRRQSAEPAQYELEPSTVRLAYQLYQYYLQDSVFARKPSIRQNLSILETVIEDWHLDPEYGSEEEYTQNQPAKFPPDWVVNQTRSNRAC